MKIIKATATERKIFDAIKAAKARGLKIVDGGWHVKWSDDESRFVPDGNKCCPLGAVLLTSNEMPLNVFDLNEGDDDHVKLTRAAAGILDKDIDWCDRFVESFDDVYEADEDKSASRAALKVRELEYSEDHGILNLIK